MGCIINSRLHTPLFPLISHRCQKEACTEIKGRIWALCSKIKLSVVIFYITFRIAHWKMFPLLELLLPLLLSLFPSFVLSFLWLLFLLLFLSATTTSHSQCNAVKWWVLEWTLSMWSATIAMSTYTLRNPGEQWLKSTSRLRTQHNGPYSLRKTMCRTVSTASQLC